MTTSLHAPVRLRHNGKGSRSMTVLHDRASRQRSGQVDPVRLDEMPFENLAVRLAFGHKRGADAQTWDRLLQSDLVVRTLNALRRAHERNQSAMESRREEWMRYTEERVGVKVDAQQWQTARREYEEWCQRASKFDSTVAKAIQDVERAQRKLIRDSGHEQGDSQFYRRQLKAVARAIYAHRTALEDGEVIAEDHDLQLWSALDTVTVPNGPLSEPTSLMAMLDERVWS